jgi:hypothetical protein
MSGNALPNIGVTADPDLPLHLPHPAGPPTNFPDLADVMTVVPAHIFLGHGVSHPTMVTGRDRTSIVVAVTATCAKRHDRVRTSRRLDSAVCAGRKSSAVSTREPE